ncbi:MAG TPA: hypothetical protein PKC18_05905, partial [Lacipirellulaceae bacterium]|nr:hypothetical protein [Lacipirellulaceae bacterium]
MSTARSTLFSPRTTHRGRRTMPLKLGKIHQGDCLELMARIDDGSVDLAFADPPCNIGYKYDKYHDRQDDQ